MRKFLLGILPWLLLLAGHPQLAAQSLEPRSYTNVPVGETFLLVGAARSEGEVSPTPSSPLQDLELTIDTGVVGLAHTFAMAGDSAKLDIGAARVCYEGSAIFRGEYTEGRRCEYADPLMKLTWNFYGAPAMELIDFTRWEPGLVIGASLQVSAPWGTYKSRHLLNAGANRWMVRPGIGGSYHWGPWHVDVMMSVRFFEDNDNFFNGIHVEQDPVYGFQSHLIRYFSRGRWLSLNMNFYTGGETTKDGLKSGDRLENSRLGLTFSSPLTSHQSIKFYGSTGTVTRIGGDFDTLGVAWQYRF